MKIKKLTLLVLACGFLVSQYSYAMQSKVTSVKKARTVSTRAKRYMALMDEIEKELNAGNVVPRNIIDDTKAIIKKYTYRYKKEILDRAERVLRTGPEPRPIPPTPPTPPIPPIPPTGLVPPTPPVPPTGLVPPTPPKKDKDIEYEQKVRDFSDKKLLDEFQTVWELRLLWPKKLYQSHMRIIRREMKKRGLKPRRPVEPKPTDLTKAEEEQLKRLKARFSRLKNKEFLEEAEKIYAMKKGALRDKLADAFREEFEKRQLRLKKETLYDVLGVARDADLREIKKARRRLLMMYHPDRLPLDATAEKKALHTKMTKKIIKAFEVLSKPGKRANYDRTL